jgi:hypothetical protein
MLLRDNNPHYEGRTYIRLWFLKVKEHYKSHLSYLLIYDGVVKSPIYGVAGFSRGFDIPYV